MGSVIAVDFDGTLAQHRFPDIGEEVPWAFYWLKRLAGHGVKFILWTMRSDGQEVGNVLTEAVEFCRQRGIEFFGVNENPEQKEWTSSPKAYANIYVDDNAAGTPLIMDSGGIREMVDWYTLGPEIENKILGK